MGPDRVWGVLHMRHSLRTIVLLVVYAVFLVSGGLLALLVAAPAAAAPSSDTRWREIGPPSRADQSVVWDSRRERALMFGGDNASGELAAAGVWLWVNDVQPHWAPFPTLGSGPEFRSGMAAVYDSLRDRVLAFGGRMRWNTFSPCTNELWSLSLAGTPEWTLLDDTAAPKPGARFDAAMVLDAHDRLVLFGGDGAVSDSSTWILPLGSLPLSWQSFELPSPNPGPRARHAVVYSPQTDRMTVFGGDRLIVSNVRDYPLRPAVTWELALDGTPQWFARATAPADTVPVMETGGRFVRDLGGDQAWLIPGNQAFNPVDVSVWRLDLHTSSWTRMPVTTGGPGPRAYTSVWREPASGHLFVFGGGGSVFGFPTGRSQIVWRLVPGTPAVWSVVTQVPNTGLAPNALYDPVSDRILLPSSSGLWASTPDAASWGILPGSTIGAPPASNTMSVLDLPHRQLLVFGGPTSASQQLWRWPLDGPGGWSVEPIAGPPQPISGAQRAHDAAHDRVVIVPVARTAAYSVNDTVLTLTLGAGGPAWVPLVTGLPAPAKRRNASVLVDEARGRLLVVGGSTLDFGGFPIRDSWALSLDGAPAWSNPIPYDPYSMVPASAGLLIDRTRDRLLLVGGAGSGPNDLGPYRTLYSAPLGALSSWTDLDPTLASPMEGGGAAFFDPARDRGLFWNNTLWELTWDFGSPVSLGAGTATADAGGIHLHWAGPLLFPYAATIERSADGGATWSHLAIVTQQQDGVQGTLDVTDASPPGGPVVYRVLLQRGGDWRVIGTAALGNLGVPVAERPLRFALAALRPNPARGDVTIELASPADATVSVEVYDLAGRRVQAPLVRSVRAGSVSFRAPLATGLAPGLYLVRASDGRAVAETRLVVMR